MTSTIKSVWGSNDNKTWTNVISTPTREEATSNVSGIAFRSTDQVELKNFNNTNYYKYHAIIGDAYTSIRDIKLYGIKEKGSSTLHDGQLTLTKNLDVPRIGPPINTDNTPHRERLIVEFNTSINPMEDGIIKDTSGRNNNGAFVNGSTNSSGSFHQRAELVSYDSDDKSFAFVNDNDFISVDTGLTGNQPFSVSVWFKMKGSRNGTDTIFHMNGDYASVHNQCWCYIDGSDNFKMDFYDNAYYVYLGPYEGQWVHAVLTYNGDASSGRCIYINGVKLPYYTGGADYGDALNLTNSSPMAIGALKHTSGVIHQYAGNMSNFKLYDISLTHQDAKTLYDMGRTGSVANPKTLQIASSLDVRGDIYGGCPVFFEVYAGGNTGGSAYMNFNKQSVVKGGGWTADTTKFYAPVSGYYKFDISMMGTYLNGRGTRIEWRINGTKYPDNTAAQMYDYQSSGVTVHLRVSGNTIAYLNVGDWMGIYNSSNDINNMYGKFTGFYLSS